MPKKYFNPEPPNNWVAHQEEIAKKLVYVATNKKTGEKQVILRNGAFSGLTTAEFEEKILEKRRREKAN